MRLIPINNAKEYSRIEGVGCEGIMGWGCGVAAFN